jgi:hypothetical protein
MWVDNVHLQKQKTRVYPIPFIMPEWHCSHVIFPTLYLRPYFMNALQLSDVIHVTNKQWLWIISFAKNTWNSAAWRFLHQMDVLIYGKIIIKVRLCIWKKCQNATFVERDTTPRLTTNFSNARYNFHFY